MSVLALTPSDVEAFLSDEELRDPEREALLRMVAAGEPIGSIARHLNLSRRSVERRLGALRREWEAGSVQELATMLARRGF